MKVSEKIFSLVDQKYKNDKEFAQAVGVAQQRVSEWRTGKSKSYMKRLDVIAAALGVTVGELHGESVPTTLADPMPGFDRDKDYIMVVKDKSGSGDTVMVSKGVRLPVEAVEVAEAYMALDTAGRNMVRRMLGLADVQSPKSQIG